MRKGNQNCLLATWSARSWPNEELGEEDSLNACSLDCLGSVRYTEAIFDRQSVKQKYSELYVYLGHWENQG